MSVNIFFMDQIFWGTLKKQLAENGMVVVRDVLLPDSFQPPISDLVFLVCEEGVEIYLDARITYVGQSAIWRQIQEQPPFPGSTRLVAQSDRDVDAACRLLRALLLDAGGSLPGGRIGEVSPVQDTPEQAPSQEVDELLSAFMANASTPTHQTLAG
jgi:hypothetical protein